MFHYLWSFVLLLTPLVFVHELGHFLFAKLFGVRVDVFSIGFGPKVLKRRRGETEYCISAVPLGGYVKLLGQDPTEVVEPEHRHRTFSSKEPWKRFLILLGGPLFNFLFAVVIFATILLVGEPHMGTRVGRVLPGSQAAVAGFHAGDLITSVDDHIVTKLEEFQTVVSESPNKELIVRVRRGQDHRDIHVTPQSVDGYSIYGELMKIGDVEGLEPFGRFPVIAVPNLRSAASVAGLKTGDVIMALNGVAVKSFEGLEDAVRTALLQKPQDMELTIIERSPADWDVQSGQVPDLEKLPRKTVRIAAESLQNLGIHSSELIVSGLLPGSPAEKAGIKTGDYLFKVNDHAVTSFSMLRQEIQKTGEKRTPARIVLLREGRQQVFSLEPAQNEVRDPLGRTAKSYAIGVYPLLAASEPEMVIERIYNPFRLAAESWSRALDLSAKTLVSIKKLASRQVSMSTLGGPLLIGKLAGDSFSRGIIAFLKAMALISISLAVFNILPIPVLDGGHIFLLAIEKVRGRPLGLKQTELIQQLGLSLIMLLLVVVLFNDFSRVAAPALQNVFR